MNFSSVKNILLGVTGSIAAYKAVELVRLLKTAGFNVHVVMSSGATEFVTPLTLETVSEHRVHQELFDPEAEAIMSHIELARWADLILIAPATAHVIAKLTVGLADDLLTTLCLASEAPIVIAPAMNMLMWNHAITQANVNQLKQRGMTFLGPDVGIQACGDTGEGRMLEPEDIVHAISSTFQVSEQLKNKKIVVTAGPTQEAIDPVRFLSNHSSGKMGYAIAEAASEAGAKVILITGPTALACPCNVQCINVISAQEMLTAVKSHMKDCDIFISAAAVADYRIKNTQPSKIKKTAEQLNLELMKNPDILATVVKEYPRVFKVGFAAETEDLLANAKQKLLEKKVDMIVANWVGENRGFGTDENELFIMTKTLEKKLPLASKKQLAKQLIEIIIQNFQKS